MLSINSSTIDPTPQISSGYTNLPGVDVNGTYYFTAEDTSAFGRGLAQLWRSDGSTAGTQLVAEIPGGESLMRRSLIDHVANVNGTLYFAAGRRGSTSQLWKSDGTHSGTVMVFDAQQGLTDPHTSIYWTANVNGTLFFDVRSSNDDQLWKSDGTSNGTTLVSDFGEHRLVSPNAVNGTLFFVEREIQYPNGNSNVTRQLMRSDGTSAGTYSLASFDDEYPLPAWTVNYPAHIAVGEDPPIYAPPDQNSTTSTQNPSLTNVNGTLYFTADDGVHGTELWKSDGTTGGTVMVRDIARGNASSYPWQLTNINGTLFFFDKESSGYGLWKSDGTSDGTVLVQNLIEPGQQIANLSSEVYFTTYSSNHHEAQLWKTNVTSAGAFLIKEYSSATSAPQGLVNVNGTLFFAVDDGTHGQELWASQSFPSQDVVRLASDIHFASAGSSPNGFVVSNNQLFFTADDGSHGNALWSMYVSSAYVTPAHLVVGEPAPVYPPPLMLTRLLDVTKPAAVPPGVNIDNSNGTATVTVTSSSTKTSVTFDSQGNPAVLVNGSPLDSYYLQGATQFLLDGGALNNQLFLGGGVGKAAQVSVQNGQLTYTIHGVNFLASRFSSVTIYGQAEDQATLYDNVGDETVYMTPGSTAVTNNGMKVQVVGFGTTYAFSTSGNDKALLYDSSGDDTFTASPGYAIMSGNGYTLEAVGFKNTVGYFVFGGQDAANLIGSTQGNTLTSFGLQSTLVGGGYTIDVIGADRVDATAGSNHDRALLYDTPADDRFVAFPTIATIYSDTTTRQVNNFAEVYAFAGNGGNDTAQLLDQDLFASSGLAPAPAVKPTGPDDRYVGFTSYSLMTDDKSYFNQVINFKSVIANSVRGNDRATFYGSGGTDMLEMDGNVNQVVISGANYRNLVDGFASIIAYAGGGQDSASLLGGNLFAEANRLSVQGSTPGASTFPDGGSGRSNVTLYNFATVNATKQVATDKVYRASAIDYILNLLGAW